jgi:hypothetical protein
LTRVVFPTDEHHPFVDWKALALAMKITKKFKPDVRFAGSDGVDFYSISKFDKDPDLFKSGLQAELDSWTTAQRLWKKVTPGAEVYFLVGNHEDRLRKYLWKHPELHGLRALSLESIFKFKELGIKMAQYDGQEQVFYNQLIVKHGSIVRGHSGYTARAEIEKEMYQISTLSGHTHRGGQVMVTTRDGVKQAVEGFCLCDVSPNYLHKPNWQNGLVLATVDKSGVEFELIPFHKDSQGNMTARWRGDNYES